MSTQDAAQEVLSSRLRVLLAEYQSLRQESLTAITNRIQILSFAFTALAVVLAALLASSVSSTAAAIIGLLFVPAASRSSLLIWLGEYRRSQRAGAHLRQTESRINILIGHSDLSWESAKTGMIYPYVAVIVFVSSVSYLGHGLGIYYVFKSLDDHRVLGISRSVIVALLILYSIITETVFCWFWWTKWREASDK